MRHEFHLEGALGRFSVAGKAGANRLTLRGRAAAKTLGVGAYRLEVRAADAAGNRSRVAGKAFSIVR